MGFGSYDEDEQRNETVTEDEDVEVDEHGEGHRGESTFELEESPDDMLSQLQEIKDAQAAEEEETDS